MKACLIEVVIVRVESQLDMSRSKGRSKDQVWVHFDCTTKKSNTGNWAKDKCKKCGDELQGIPSRMKVHLKKKMFSAWGCCCAPRGFGSKGIKIKMLTLSIPVILDQRWKKTLSLLSFQTASER